jgi:hypothetical protein
METSDIADVSTSRYSLGELLCRPFQLREMCTAERKRLQRALMRSIVVSNVYCR